MCSVLTGFICEVQRCQVLVGCCFVVVVFPILHFRMWHFVKAAFLKTDSRVIGSIGRYTRRVAPSRPSTNQLFNLFNKTSRPVCVLPTRHPLCLLALSLAFQIHYSLKQAPLLSAASIKQMDASQTHTLPGCATVIHH